MPRDDVTPRARARLRATVVLAAFVALLIAIAFAVAFRNVDAGKDRPDVPTSVAR
jgi:hypothetical protein